MVVKFSVFVPFKSSVKPSLLWIDTNGTEKGRGNADISSKVLNMNERRLKVNVCQINAQYILIDLKATYIGKHGNSFCRISSEARTGKVRGSGMWSLCRIYGTCKENLDHISECAQFLSSQGIDTS